MSRVLAALLCFSAIVATGCDQSSQSPADIITEPDELGGLPYLRQSADSRLHDELARIE